MAAIFRRPTDARWSTICFRTDPPHPLATVVAPRTLSSLRPLSSLLLLALPVMVLPVSCARLVPENRPAAVLYRDLQRLVSVADETGWDIDRFEVEELLPDALMSVCHVPLEDRRDLGAWLDLRIQEHGGSVEALYQQRERDLGNVSELLELTRIRMVLHSSTVAASTDCPFWVEPDPEFVGRQTSDDQWLLSGAGGGKMSFVSQGGRQDVNFGGAGRLLIGRSFGSRWTVLLGAELGASLSFPRSGQGDRNSLILGFDGVAPVVLRYRFVNTYVEAELGYLARFTETDFDVQNGLHTGLAFGAKAPRQLFFFPGLAFAVNYERTFPTSAQGPALDSLKFGFRVTIDLNL